MKTRIISGIILFFRSEHELLEKDYSIKRLLEAARNKGVLLRVVKPEQFEMVVTRGDRTSILIDDKAEPLPDFVIPRTGSETTYYAFSVIRKLQSLGVYVCNGADAIYSVKDKLYMHQLLANSKLATPQTMLAKFPVLPAIVRREIGFPLVIKNVSGTEGAGIYLCDSEDKFIDIMELIYTNNKKANIILQEFIKTSRGRDLRVFIVGGKVAACMLRSSSTSFKANYSKGAQVSAYQVTDEIEWLATETAKVFNLDIAGVELLFDEHGFKVCEANSAPDFCGLESVAGKVIAEQIIDYILVRIGYCS